MSKFIALTEAERWYCSPMPEAQPPATVSTKLVFVLLSACALGLGGCTKPLDHVKLEQQIQDSVIKQGGVSLKTVSCPNDVKPEADKAFTCLGTLDTGGTFAINVQQKDSQGTMQWDIPSVRGLVNVAKLETLLQATLTSESRTALRVACGDAYRAVRPGETFDCSVQLAPQLASKATEGTIAQTVSTASTRKAGTTKSVVPAKIVVTMDAEGTLNWQEILPRTPALKVANDAKVDEAMPAATTSLQRRPPVTIDTAPDPKRPSDSEVVVE